MPKESDHEIIGKYLKLCCFNNEIIRTCLNDDCAVFRMWTSRITSNWNVKKDAFKQLGKEAQFY